MRKAGLAAFLLAMVCTGATKLHAQEPHGVVLLYHHVSNSTPAITSISPELFAAHLDYLVENRYQVVPLAELLHNLYGAGDPAEVPANAVAITFDDAYISVYETAFPLLRERGMPFSLFVASKPLDEQWDDFFTWADLREMLAAGAELGAHSHSHDWLARQQPGESNAAWRDRVQREIDTNMQRLEAETGIRPISFAYPFGESNQWVEQMVGQRGLYGLVQNSGAVGSSFQDSLALPRFPMATGFASLQRLSLALDTRPLPVHQVQANADLSQLRFRLGEAGYRPGQLNCFSSAGTALEIARQGDEVRVQLPSTVPGRNKINCTSPAADGSGDFYWYSHQWLSPRPDGSWPAF